MKGLSVVIITFNEEKNIGRCIDSVKTVADEVIVLDSFSTDRTTAIAAEKGAIVKQQEFRRYIQQKNKALQLARFDYVLSLDADEALSVELAASILAAKQHFDGAAFTMNRSNFFCTKFIRHGLWYPDRKLRLFDKNTARWGGYDPHDRVITENQVEVTHLKGDLLHYAYYSIGEYLIKNERISAIAAHSLFELGIRKPWWKIYLSPVWEFVNGYIVKLGFLDGYYGLLIAIHTANQNYMKQQLMQKLQKNEIREMAWK
jgi:glycosyltransferase involved in cell wall biosynthesis